MWLQSKLVHETDMHTMRCRATRRTSCITQRRFDPGTIEEDDGPAAAELPRSNSTVASPGVFERLFKATPKKPVRAACAAVRWVMAGRARCRWPSRRCPCPHPHQKSCGNTPRPLRTSARCKDICACGVGYTDGRFRVAMERHFAQMCDKALAVEFTAWAAAYVSALENAAKSVFTIIQGALGTPVSTTSVPRVCAARCAAHELSGEPGHQDGRRQDAGPGPSPPVLLVPADLLPRRQGVRS